MNIYIKSNVDLPEVPDRVEMEAGTLRDLLLLVFRPLHFVDEIIDRKTGEIKLEGFFEVRLNNTSSHALTHGLDEELRDGDTVQINLLVFGGG